MTPEMRQTLKQLIDRHRRMRIANDPACSGCGGPLDCRTVGCKRCSERHRRRERMGYRSVQETVGFCRSCGCPWAERTAGCQSCRSRHRYRRRRLNGAPAGVALSGAAPSIRREAQVNPLGRGLTAAPLSNRTDAA